MTFLKLAMAVTASAFVNFHATVPANLSTGVPAVKTFNWAGRSGDLSVILTFEQGNDSIYARGAYEVAATKRVGCGGAALPSSGLFTMRARGTRRSFKGRFLFDSGWSPSVSAARTASGDIKVSIRSVNRGACPMILHPTPKANPALRHQPR